MNIFALDPDPQLAAIYHCDAHVHKMILESCQMMCTVLIQEGHNNIPYKYAHGHHPCTKWLGQSIENWNWLSQLVIHLQHERRYRFGSDYHSSLIITLDLPTPSLPDIGLTPFAQAMPDDCKQPDSILAYRQYYRQHKSHLHHWTKRNPPDWL